MQSAKCITHNTQYKLPTAHLVLVAKKESARKSHLGLKTPLSQGAVHNKHFTLYMQNEHCNGMCGIQLNTQQWLTKGCAKLVNYTSTVFCTGQV